MIREDKVIVVDVDGTLTLDKREGESYAAVRVSAAMRERLVQLKSEGYWIILYTSRNMRTHQGNIGAIMKHTAPTLIDWLLKHEIPYDELHFGKPWCGNGGLYVDDRAVRPREFIEYSKAELMAILARDKVST